MFNSKNVESNGEINCNYEESKKYIKSVFFKVLISYEDGINYIYNRFYVTNIGGLSFDYVYSISPGGTFKTESSGYYGIIEFNTNSSNQIKLFDKVIYKYALWMRNLNANYTVSGSTYYRQWITKIKGSSYVRATNYYGQNIGLCMNTGQTVWFYGWK